MLRFGPKVTAVLMLGTGFVILAGIDSCSVQWNDAPLKGTVVSIHGDSTDAGPFIRSVRVRLVSGQEVTTDGTKVPISEGCAVGVTEGRTRILKREVFRISGIGD